MESTKVQTTCILASFYNILLCCSAATPGSQKATAAISGGSIADYVCFTLRKPGSDEVVAIIIETKMDKISHHAVAQVITFSMCLLPKCSYSPVFCIHYRQLDTT